MLYQAYQAFCDVMTPARTTARLATNFRDSYLDGAIDLPLGRRLFAVCDTFATATITHRRPAFGIDAVLSGHRRVPVREQVVMALPFGDLLHFAKPQLGTPQPKVLVVAPLSGHFATLLRDTVATLLPDHDVYITDWKNARNVPLSAGAFGIEDYTDYVIRFLHALGPGAHVLAVCQPCVPVLAAVALLAEDHDPCQPRSMALIGGPIDTREAPTVVNQLASQRPLSWFEENVIKRVPLRHPGARRRVYPGFVQLMAFMSMNMGRHVEQFRNFYQYLADAKMQDADKISDFYDEYFAVLDLPAEFYLETIDRVFQRTLLAKGELTHRGRSVDPGAIRHTALLTIEGMRDDICSVGQTAAAHRLCSSLRPHLKRHHLQPGVGHYGLFSGSRWEREIYPQVQNLVLAMS
jgi:polyhydroxyalkanoate depolymerase